MRLLNKIQAAFSRKSNAILRYTPEAYINMDCGCMPFGRLMFLNIADLITDIYSEVIWNALPGYNTPKYKAWKSFVSVHGQRILSSLLCEEGFMVIGYKQDEQEDWWFRELTAKDYTKSSSTGVEVVIPKDPSWSVYVLKSPTFEQNGVSDYALCVPVISYLDNAMNASATICKRLGTVVVASPKQPASATMPLTLGADEKADLEQALQTDYGALRKQNQIMLLPAEMNIQTINLAGLDTRTQERVLIGIKIICDRLKVPASQVSLIEASSSRSLSNGSELREGDLAKYRTFRRLLNSTFFDFAEEIGLKVDYEIENEPRTVQGQTIENLGL